MFDKLLEKMLEGKINPQEIIENMLEGLFPIEFNVKIHGKKEGRIWISIRPIKQAEAPKQEEQTE